MESRRRTSAPVADRGMSFRTSRRAFLFLGANVVAGTKALQSGPLTSRLVSSTTPPLPKVQYRSRPDLSAPQIILRRGFGSPVRGYVCITPAGPMLIDKAGGPVWIQEVPHASTNLQVQQFQGNNVLTWWQGEVADYGIGYGEYVVMDTSYRQLMTVTAQNGLSGDLHEFSIGPNGVGYFTAYRTYSADLSSVDGPRNGTALDATIQGVDLASGKLVFDWRSSDHIAWSETYQGYYKGTPFDPVHLNSVGFTSDGNLLFSGRNTWTLYKVNATSGEIVWRMGGRLNDFKMGDGAHFSWQHHARVHSNGRISLFDNEGVPAEAKQSRALVLNVNESALSAHVSQQFSHPGDPLLSGSQGSCQLLPGGGAVIGWGSEPYYTEFNADGEMILDGRLESGTSYRAFSSGWTGTPLDVPAVVLEKDKKGQSLVYVSWNGSTETVGWRLLTGTNPRYLKPGLIVARTDFETAIRVPPRSRHVAVAALDRHGKVLAQSKTLALD